MTRAERSPIPAPSSGSTSPRNPAQAPVLACAGLVVGYGDLAVARGLDIHVASGEVVALLGPNGVGKTTTLMTLVGGLKALEGSVLWHGETVSEALHGRARRGLAFVPETKSVVMGMSVRDNLRVAKVDVERAVEIFPELGRLLGAAAGVLSGGEQQMLSVARALARVPDAIVVDELSLGLAPMVSDRLANALRASADAGAAVLVVEQNLRRALMMSDRFYLMRNGGVAVAGESGQYVARIDEIETLFLTSTAAVVS